MNTAAPSAQSTTAKEANGAQAGSPQLKGRALLNARFQAALDSIWFAYQPIADTKWTIMGYEAFLRCREPSLENPRAFLASAERLGRQQDLLARIRAVVTEPVMNTQTASLFMNLHPSHFKLEDPKDPCDMFAQHRDRIVLEITQRHPLANDGDMERFLCDLRRRGYRIAVDDLGSGYSGIGNFEEAGPQFVKLGADLVREAGKHAPKQRVIQGVCEMCKDLGVKVIAEAVEDQGEFETLKGLGCDLFQGYFVGRPEPLEV
jgi:EAL domain-containing protein (putative c-di-GMP-specific phosphodiesterase class I)